MISYIILGLAVLAGYTVTVGLALAGTVGIASASPRFVLADHRVRGPFKLVHELLWLLCTTAGGYVTAHIGMDVSAWQQELVLIAALLYVLWTNTWEARQRGTAHQILISFLTVVGVVSGFWLRLH